MRGEGQTGWDGGPQGRRKGAGPLPAFSGEGSILSFGGAWREWTHSGIVGGGGEPWAPALDESLLGVGPTLWDLEKTCLKSQILPNPSS